MTRSRAKVVRMGLTACVLVIAGLLYTSNTFAGGTLAAVRSKGFVRCGVSEDLAGFSYRDGTGRRQGFAVDFCRAVAAAALGDGEKATFTPLTSPARFPALLSGKIDLLAHTTTVTFGREAGIGVHFTGVYFYDGQSFLIPRSSGIKRIEDLNGATICVEKGTTHPAALENLFQMRGLTYTPLMVDSLAGATEAFFGGRCRAYTADRSKLAAVRVAAPGGPDRFEILPENFSKEPLGPVVRRGDEEWLTLVRWVLFALIGAEEFGVTQENVRVLQKTATNPLLQKTLNTSGELGKSLGLKPDWLVNVLSQVGNYGEIYERHFGSKSVLKIERGLNRLWNQGGLLYAPSFQ